MINTLDFIPEDDINAFRSALIAFGSSRTESGTNFNSKLETTQTDICRSKLGAELGEVEGWSEGCLEGCIEGWREG